MLVLGSMILLSLTFLSVNTALLEHEEASLEGECQLVITSVTQALMEEAIGRAFDEVTLDDPPTPLPESFTAAENLGPDAGESYPGFDDVDDFNGYCVTDTTTVGFTYTLKAVVEYVVDSDPDGAAESSPTFYKRFTARTACDYLSSDTVVSCLVSYWGY